MLDHMPKKIILDTDLCGDCDDVGALAILLNLDRLGYAKTLAVTYCLGNPWGSDFIQHTLDWFGRNDIPYGKLTDYTFANYPVHDERFIRPISSSSPARNAIPRPGTPSGCCGARWQITAARRTSPCAASADCTTSACSSPPVPMTFPPRPARSCWRRTFARWSS